MVKKFLIAVGAIVAVLLIVIVIQPSAFVIERKTIINAAPSFSYAYVDDLHKWAAWSPWEKLDGVAGPQKKFSGPDTGVGAHSEWSGEKTGSGEMTITEAKPNEKIAIDVNFTKPFAEKNVTTFTFSRAEGGSTGVSWSMTGKRNFISKAFGLVMDMDKMAGPDFEKGLADLKRLAEADAKAAADALAAAAEMPAADAMADGGMTVDAGTP